MTTSIETGNHRIVPSASDTNSLIQPDNRHDTRHASPFTLAAYDAWLSRTLQGQQVPAELRNSLESTAESLGTSADTLDSLIPGVKVAQDVATAVVELDSARADIVARAAASVSNSAPSIVRALQGVQSVLEHKHLDPNITAGLDAVKIKILLEVLAKNDVNALSEVITTLQGLKDTLVAPVLQVATAIENTLTPLMAMNQLKSIAQSFDAVSNTVALLREQPSEQTIRSLQESLRGAQESLGCAIAASVADSPITSGNYDRRTLERLIENTSGEAPTFEGWLKKFSDFQDYIRVTSASLLTLRIEGHIESGSDELNGEFRNLQNTLEAKVKELSPSEILHFAGLMNPGDAGRSAAENFVIKGLLETRCDISSPEMDFIDYLGKVAQQESEHAKSVYATTKEIEETLKRIETLDRDLDGCSYLEQPGCFKYDSGFSALVQRYSEHMQPFPLKQIEDRLNHPVPEQARQPFVIRDIFLDTEGRHGTPLLRDAITTLLSEAKTSLTWLQAKLDHLTSQEVPAAEAGVVQELLVAFRRISPERQASLETTISDLYNGGYFATASADELRHALEIVGGVREEDKRRPRHQSEERSLVAIPSSSSTELVVQTRPTVPTFLEYQIPCATDLPPNTVGHILANPEAYDVKDWNAATTVLRQFDSALGKIRVFYPRHLPIDVVEVVAKETTRFSGLTPDQQFDEMAIYLNSWEVRKLGANAPTVDSFRDRMRRKSNDFNKVLTQQKTCNALGDFLLSHCGSLISRMGLYHSIPHNGTNSFLSIRAAAETAESAMGGPPLTVFFVLHTLRQHTDQFERILSKPFMSAIEAAYSFHLNVFKPLKLNTFQNAKQQYDASGASWLHQNFFMKHTKTGDPLSLEQRKFAENRLGKYQEAAKIAYYAYQSDQETRSLSYDLPQLEGF